MIHQERISFDKGENHFILASREYYSKYTKHHLLYLLAAAIIFTGWSYALLAVPSDTQVFYWAVVIGCCVIAVGISAVVRNVSRTKE